MSKLLLKSVPVGMLSTNCYLLMNQDTKELLVVDPGGSPERIIREISSMDGRPVAVLLTHGHFDHILAVNEIKEKYQIKVYIHEAENNLLLDGDANLSKWQGLSQDIEADETVSDLQVLDLIGTKVQVILTPGHTPGSCCYYIEEGELLLSGDTLFAGSCGRTDFPGGSMKEMQNSLQRLLSSLPEDTKVYPGHGGGTSIGYEKRYNPFV